MDIPNRNRWVKEWNNESVDRRSAQNGLHGMSKRMVEATRQKYGDVCKADNQSLNDRLESERDHFSERRVHSSSSYSSNMGAQEDGTNEEGR